MEKSLRDLYMQVKIIQNWQKENYQLSQMMIDSLEGLDVWETILTLGKVRRGTL